MEVRVYAHDQRQANLSMGWLVCACITIFHEVITIFFLFWQFSVGQIHFGRCILAPCGAHKCFWIAILKKRKKKHCYQYKDFNHRCKGYTLGKTPVSLPITTGYSLPPTWDRFRQKKKRQSNYKWGMPGQNCTSLHWTPHIRDRRQLILAHQATFQIGRQFRFPWQPAENGWLEIGLIRVAPLRTMPLHDARCCAAPSLEPGPSRARYFLRDMLLLTTTAPFPSTSRATFSAGRAWLEECR